MKEGKLHGPRSVFHVVGVVVVERRGGEGQRARGVIRGLDFGSWRGERARDVCFGFEYPELERGMLVYTLSTVHRPSRLVHGELRH